MLLRELISVAESVGLAQRRPGDKFVSPQGGPILYFQRLDFYPDSGSFGSEEEMQTAIDKLDLTIEWSNQSRGSLGFGIAQFKDDADNTYHLGRYFRTISANRLENRFPNDLPGGYRLQSKAAIKERSGYKPTDILTNLKDQTPDGVLNQIIAKFGEDSDEVRATRAFMESTSYPMRLPLGKMNFDAFTNYFCELLQPMALVMGKMLNGNAHEAEKEFLGGQGFNTCKITFGGGKTEGLTDSTLTNPAGASIGISSKAKSGAKASARNLDDKVKELTGTDTGRDMLSNFPDEIKIINDIVDGGYDGGPLNLAMQFGIITQQEHDQIRSLRKLGPQEIIGKGLISPRLEQMYAGRNVKDPARVVPFFHLLATCAYAVAAHVNEKTKFSKAASAILNHGAFIQVYTNARQQGTDIVLDKFDAKYPSEAVTDVLLSAEKTYFSTGNKGNFTFHILKNGATMTDVEATADDDVVEPAAPKKAPVKHGTLRSEK
jgi:hypothetical protein